MQRMSFACPAGGKRFDRHNPDARVRLGNGASNRAGTVGAAVVDDENLEIRVCLLADRREAVGQGRLFVARGNDRGD